MPLLTCPCCRPSCCLNRAVLQGVQGISDIITIPGLVNVDFADVKVQTLETLCLSHGCLHPHMLRCRAAQRCLPACTRTDAALS